MILGFHRLRCPVARAIATPAPRRPCRWRTPSRRRGGRTRRRRTPCSRSVRPPCAHRRCRRQAAGPAPTPWTSFPPDPPVPPVHFTGFAVTGVPPRPTPRTPSPRMTFVTRPRPIPAGSRPRAISRARIFPYPYTAMRKSKWISKMPRASASQRTPMRLTGRALHTAAARRDGPAVQRFGQCPADRPDPGTALEFVDVRDVDAVSGQAQPRKKPMPSSRPPRAPASPTGI